MKKIYLFFLIIFLSFSLMNCLTVPCNSRSIGAEEDKMIVCVCNETRCDSLDPIGQIELGVIYHLLSSKDGHRFNEENISAINHPSSDTGLVVNFEINRDVKYQKIFGFGGAFTDAAGINILSLNELLQNDLINSYFANDGLEYNIQRIPIGGADFSTHPYTYADVQGSEENPLENWELQKEDFDYKIPFAIRAKEMNPKLKLFASPWSAPPWMKSNNDYKGFGVLKVEYYSLWADYFKKFLEAYKALGLEFWAITAQNEPTAGLTPFFPFNCMGWNGHSQKNFVQHHLGPMIRNSEFNETKIIILDDQRYSITEFSRTILSDPESAQYVSGMGMHWYSNFWFPPTTLDLAHAEFPDYWVLNTEACAGYLHFIPGIDHVELGAWRRARLYAHNIIEDLNHWVVGWVEWNLALDMDGGPNWANNQVDAPIIVNSEAQEFYKNPMYYAIGHFSKYIPEDSNRIHGESENGGSMHGLEILSILRTDNQVTLVVYNPTVETILLRVRDIANSNEKSGGMFEAKILPDSLNTFVYSDLKIAAESDGQILKSLFYIYFISLFIVKLFS